MPIIGFIIGLTQINRNKHGLWIVVRFGRRIPCWDCRHPEPNAGEAAVFSG
jgi:hypothetical protein